MRGLVESDLAATRQPKRGPVAPILLLDFRGNDSLALEPLDGRIEVIAHQVENCPHELVRRMALDEVPARRVDGDLGWWQGEDEPPIPRILTPEPEHVAKEAAIGVWVLAVEQEVSPRDHPSVLRNAAQRRAPKPIPRECLTLRPVLGQA